MASKKKQLLLKNGLTRADIDSLDDIGIGTKVEFFYTNEDGLIRSAVGRVCDEKPSGLCCVEFVTFGCKPVSKNQLVRTTKAAPNCSAGCTNC